MPTNYQSSSSHGYSSEKVYSGSKSHKAWIYAEGPSCVYPANCNHRGYPTIQLHKLSSGGFKTPVSIEFYANLDITLSKSTDWFSFITISADSSDQWKRVVLVNIDSKNNAYLMHVPIHNQSIKTYQNSSLIFPRNSWVKITTCIDLNPTSGFAKVWQDDVLLSSSNVSGGCGVVEQVHLGLYASPNLSMGTIYNDDVVIREVASCP